MNKLRQITAWITIVVIVGFVIAAFICGITGSEYFLGVLFLALAIPVVLWVFMWFTNLVNENPDETEDKLEESTDVE